MIAMFLMAIGMVGAAAQDPRPNGDVSGWVTINDYPREALDAHQQGSVAFSLQVDQAGDVIGCSIERGSGAPALDRATCALLFGRAHFEPARDATGAAVAGRYRSRVSWVYPVRVEAEAPNPALAPIEVRGSIRDGQGGSVLRVDTNGIITKCEQTARPYDNIAAPPDICGLFPVGARYGPPALSKGRPVKRKITIRLSVFDVNTL